MTRREKMLSTTFDNLMYCEKMIREGGADVASWKFKKRAYEAVLLAHGWDSDDIEISKKLRRTQEEL